jgi:hypothetical protein
MDINSKKPNTDVVVLVKVNNVHSEDLFTVDFLVDPWRLFDTDRLSFGSNWMISGTINEGDLDLSRPGPKASTSFLPRLLPTVNGVRHNNRAMIALDRETRVPYKYKPLRPGDIRLLYLLPGEAIDPLQAAVVHVSQKSTATYRALSYVWGTEERTQELITPDGLLQITLSLSKAMRRLRQKGSSIMLWVDAVSINQNDSKEKAQQIRLLPQIFQASKLTYAFIDGDREVDAVMEMLMQVRSKAALDERSMPGINGKTSNGTIDSDDWPAGLPKIPASWNGGSIPPLHDPIWASVKAMFALPWFGRVWIIQEIVAAPSVMIVCGKWVIDWNDLHLAMETVDREVQISGQEHSMLKSGWDPFLSLAAQREWEARRYRWSLLMLLEQFRHAQSTLSRDRLFALLGLASDGNENEFEPDYDSPLEEVVLRFARVFVRQNRGMQLLYRAGISSRSNRFPSWIPDWTAKRPLGLHDSAETGITFSASGPQEASIKCIPGTDELRVQGYDVDVIEGISTASNIKNEWKRYFEDLDEMIDSAVLSSVGDSPADLKWKVPVAGALFPRAAGSGAIDMKTSYIAFRNYLEVTGKGSGVKECRNGGSLITNRPSDSSSYIAALEDTLNGWRFVVTKRGYAGVVPTLTEVGDIVVVLKGGCVPFVMRKSATRPGQMRLVGECYIHGIMGGQSLWLPGVAEREFRLH